MLIKFRAIKLLHLFDKAGLCVDQFLGPCYCGNPEGGGASLRVGAVRDPALN